jgi:hypothetical protein
MRPDRRASTRSHTAPSFNAGASSNGIHIDTQSRGVSPYTSVNPLYLFRTAVGADGSDQRLFPWRAVTVVRDRDRGEGPVQCRHGRDARAGSVAYGHPTLEFIVVSSGHHVYLTMLAYATIEGHDFVAADAGTGKVIVSTTLRDNPVYGPQFRRQDDVHSPPATRGIRTRLGADRLPRELAPNSSGIARMRRAVRRPGAIRQSRRLPRATTFHFTNEVYGDGEIGIGINLGCRCCAAASGRPSAASRTPGA